MIVTLWICVFACEYVCGAGTFNLVWNAYVWAIIVGFTRVVCVSFVSGMLRLYVF